MKTWKGRTEDEQRAINAAYAKVWRARNETKADEINSRYYLNHREEVLERLRKYYQKNRERIRARRKELRKIYEKRNLL